MTGQMDESEILYELKIREDLKHSLEMYDLGELETAEDIKEGLDIISEVAKNYRHVHVDLKSKLFEDHP